MNINDAIFQHDIVKNILYKNENNEISDDLKIKLLNFRIKVSKVQKTLEEDVKEFINLITPPQMNELLQKLDKTEEEVNELKEMDADIKSKYTKYLTTRSKDETGISSLELTEDEYQEIVKVNINHDITLNNGPLSAQDFLIVIHDLFVH